MEATLLILLSLLLLSLTVWNIAVHRRLSRARTQDAANRAQLDATLQALARRLSDAEDLLGTMSHPEAGDVEPEHTEAEMTDADFKGPEEGIPCGVSLRPAEAELLAKLSRYRQRLEGVDSSQSGLAEAL